MVDSYRWLAVLAGSAAVAAAAQPAPTVPNGPASVQMLPTVKIKVAAMDGGTVSWPGGSCAPKPGENGAICTAEVPKDKFVIFNAKPAAGKMLEYWDGACQGMGQCKVLAMASADLVARFMPQAVRLQVQLVGGAKLESIFGQMQGGKPLPGSTYPMFYAQPGAKLTLVMLSKAWQYTSGCDEESAKPAGAIGYAQAIVCKVTMDEDRIVTLGVNNKKSYGPKKIKLF